MPDLILTTTTTDTPARTCQCERVQRYGISMCRTCAWRLLTPPPARAGRFKAESPRNEERSMVGIAGCGSVESTKVRAAALRRLDRHDRKATVALRD